MTRDGIFQSPRHCLMSLVSGFIKLAARMMVARRYCYDCSGRSCGEPRDLAFRQVG